MPGFMFSGDRRMTTNILEYLDASAARCPDKVAFGDDAAVLTFSQLRAKARRAGSYAARFVSPRSPVAVLMEKTPDCLAAFLAAVCAGCFYVPLDTKMPTDRLRLIFDTLRPAFVFYDAKNEALAKKLAKNARTASFDEVSATAEDAEALAAVRSQHVDTDLLYVLFTSGSTGVPKGVAISHRSIIDWADWLHNALDIDETAVFGNQAPFVFDNSTLDIYSTLKNGATCWILPKKCFSFPRAMMKFLEERKINTIFFVPSALIQLANSGILDAVRPTALKRVYFCGEVMPNRQLNMWRKALPKAKFCNMYGPTEITDVCAYYLVDRDFGDDEPLPIGRACANTRIILLDEHDRPPAPGEQGELCVLGTCLSPGYYNAPDQTAGAFCQNPLNSAFPERMYRTGDLARYNEQGELMFLGRKDFQIKHQGCHRIELGEVEAALLSVPAVENGCCLFDAPRDEIVCAYAGSEEGAAVLGQMKRKLPVYMLPNRFVRLERLPMTASGKIDRAALRILCIDDKPL